MFRVFEKTELNRIILKNRFVRSATWEGMATEDGRCIYKLVKTMVNLAKGGVGLIITGHTYIDRSGQASPFQLGIDRDELIPDLKEMTGEVHEKDGQIILQITHAGCQAIPKLSGSEPVGPSAFGAEGKAICREMTVKEIEAVVKQFGDAAVRAKKAGFDGVQIHSAHGYLLSQFLSPFYNKRTDRYGGSLENRARFLINTVRAVREKTGDDFPLLIKMNSEDFIENGLTVDEMVSVAGMLEREGVDAIELSGGTIHSNSKLRPVRPGKLDSEDKEVYYREAAAHYKEIIKVPLILVGGFRSFEVAEKAVNEGIADYISMSRPLIREPDLIERWKSGDHSRASCVSCNMCFRPGVKGEGIYCVPLKTEKEG